MFCCFLADQPLRESDLAAPFLVFPVTDPKIHCVQPLRQAVDNENLREYNKLKTAEYKFQAEDAFRGDRAKMMLKDKLKDTPPNPALRLKTGAQVMLLANLDLPRGLVNGSRGVIVDWISAAAGPGRPANTIGGGGAFGGEEWRERAAREFMDNQEEDLLPVVFFATGETHVIRPYVWCIDLDRDNSLARTQLPLALAWALTIHKSQGQTYGPLRPGESLRFTELTAMSSGDAGWTRCRLSWRRRSRRGRRTWPCRGAGLQPG